MKRTTTINTTRGLAIALPALALVIGCAGRKPVAEIARAEQAVRHAQTTSEAARYAPVELASAQAKLAAARNELDDNDYEDARRLAEQALADAQLAESKAESQLAREQAARTRQDIEALQAEAASPDTVVIETQKTVRTTSAPATMVVERQAVPSTVVVERAVPPPTTVVVERAVPPPTTVVVERAVPPPTTVVVERPVTTTTTVIESDPAVVVVPE